MEMCGICTHVTHEFAVFPKAKPREKTALRPRPTKVHVHMTHTFKPIRFIHVTMYKFPPPTFASLVLTSSCNHELTYTHVKLISSWMYDTKNKTKRIRHGAVNNNY